MRSSHVWCDSSVRLCRTRRGRRPFMCCQDFWDRLAAPAGPLPSFNHIIKRKLFLAVSSNIWVNPASTAAGVLGWTLQVQFRTTSVAEFDVKGRVRWTKRKRWLLLFLRLRASASLHPYVSEKRSWNTGLKLTSVRLPFKPEDRFSVTLRTVQMFFFSTSVHL